MPLFAGNKHILNAAATMNPTGERVNMAAVLIVPAFFIFSCSLQALYESMILIRNPKINNVNHHLLYMTTQVYLAGLSTQGTNQLPLGF